MFKRAILLVFVSATCVLAHEGEHQHARVPGEVIGKVEFAVSCAPASRPAFAQAVAKLHSFWYEEAERDFNAIAEKDPACTMAYWGVAMSNFHPLWYPPTAAEAGRAQAALEQAKAHPAKTERERAYVAAMDAFFRGFKPEEHKQRAQAYAQAMEHLAKAHPKDKEATIFFALALLGTASPSDKTFANQKQAGALLEPLFKQYPKHPGLAHYIIHSYDYTALAPLGLHAARAYAKIAPSVPHALHMPSHIFVRLGLWEEAARSNEASAQAARNYEAKTNMGDGVAWDQRLHALDYLEYAYLQMGQLDKAKQVLDEVAAVKSSKPNNTTAAYAQGAIPARYLLEQQKWAEAAKLAVATDLPESQAITYWARAVGAARSGYVAAAKESLAALESLRDKMKQSPGPYPWHTVAEVQVMQAAAWIANAEGKHEEAVRQMRAAADLEDNTAKHPVTPGAVLPGREQLADLLLAVGKPAEAAKEYEATLRDAPKRRHSVKALERQQVATK